MYRVFIDAEIWKANRHMYMYGPWVSKLTGHIYKDWAIAVMGWARRKDIMGIFGSDVTFDSLQYRAVNIIMKQFYSGFTLIKQT